MQIQSRKSHQGAALFVALIILLMVTLMGVAGMRSGIFHERMAFNSQAEDMTFQAAESAIGAVLSSANTPGDNTVGMLINTGAAITKCVTFSAGLVDGACNADGTGGHYLDIRQVLLAQQTSRFDYEIGVANTDAAVFSDFQFHTIGEGDYVSTVDLPYESRNRQEWRKRGPSGAFELSGGQYGQL